MLSHCEDLRSEVPERSDWVDAVRRDWRSAELTPRERSLCEFAAQLTKAPGQMKESAVKALRRVGLDDRAILDLAHVIGFFAYANRIVDGLGCDLEPEMNSNNDA